MVNRRRLNILFVNYYGIEEGGAPLSTSLLMNSLKKNGYNVAIVSKNSYQDIETYKIKDIRKVPFFFLRDWYLKKHLKKIIKERSIDILHCADGRFSVVASVLAAQECEVPLVLHFRDYWFNCLKGDLIASDGEICSGIVLWKCLRCKKFKRLFWELYKVQYFNKRKKMINQADSIVSVSFFVKEQLKLIGITKKVNVVYNPLPAVFPEKTLIQNRKKLVLFIGSLFKHKGIDVFLNVARLLAGGNNNVKFLIVGMGDEYENCRKYIFDNDLVDVELAGYMGRKQIPDIYKKVDIVFLPSLCFDTFSRSVIESLSFSKAVVASSMGGNKEIIKNGVNGFLVDPYDVKSCAELILKLATDDKLRESISLRAYQRSLDFSVDKISAKVMSIYNDIV